MNKKTRIRRTMVSKNEFDELDKLQKKKRYYQFIYHILILLFLIFIPVCSVHAASKLELYYDKKNVTYTGQKVTYKLGNKVLNNKVYPGVIINGTSLVSAYDMFHNSSINFNYTYSSKTNKITFNQDFTTVEMTVGSKTAYIDGVKTNISVAPMIIKYRSTGKTKIMVPARFVAEAFGYSYSWNSNTSIATLKAPNSKPLNLFYDDKWTTYRGTQGKVVIDQKVVNVDTLPSIILNKTTMLQAYKVFSASTIGAKYSYDKNTNTATLVKGDVSIVLTMGNKTALVNGAEKVMDEAPRLVKNKANGKSYVMVQGSFIAENLGYQYVWDNSTKTSKLTTYIEPEIPTTPEQPAEPDTNYITYQIIPEMLEEYNSVNTIENADLTNGNTSTANIVSVTKDSASYTNKTSYVISSNIPFSNISSSYTDDRTINIHLNSATASDASYVMADGVVNNISTVFNSNNNSVDIAIALNIPRAKYNIELSADNYIMKLNVYDNYLSGITADSKSGNEVITFNGLYLPNPVVTATDEYIYLDFPNTINALGEHNDAISGRYVKGISVTSEGGNTRIAISKLGTDDYYIDKTGDTCILTIGTKKVVTEDPKSIKIKLPYNISSSDIENTDLYYKNQFKLTIPGDQTAFYNINPIDYSNAVISNIKVSLNSVGNTDILVTTKKLQGYKISDINDGFTVVIDDPKKIYDKIVVLDAGHGGTDPGAIYGGYNEKDINYKIIYTLAKSFFNNSTSDIKAYWTRYDNTFISLSDRAAFAKKVGADLFISLHMNVSTANSSASGTEIYYSSANNANTATGLSSYKLATSFISSMTKELGMRNRGVKQNGLYVCKYNSVPAILIELGFMTNSSDLKKITDEAVQKKAAQTIYNAVQNVFKQYPTGR